jgi:hypothetical protein
MVEGHSGSGSKSCNKRITIQASNPPKLGEGELSKLLKPYKMNWFQNAVSSQQGFNGIMGGVIIVSAILYLSHS